MEIHVSDQLLTAAGALILGGVGAWIYDALGALRRQGKSAWLTVTADILYVVLWMLALLRFALYRGGGELRLYAVAFAALGAIGYALWCGPLLRPLLGFWVESGAQMLRLLFRPIRFMAGIIKKWARRTKKLFQFVRKYATMKKYKWEFTRAQKRSARQGGRDRHERQEGKD